MKAQASPGAISMMTCSVTIEKPDIILVENLDDLNTNAIILNVRFSIVHVEGLESRGAH